MNKLSIMLFVAALFVTGCDKQDKTADTETQPTGKTYLCKKDSNSFNVIENARKEGNDDVVDLTLDDNKTLTLKNVVSASGAKYSDNTFVWWTKGDNATFDDGKSTFDCSASK